MNKGTIVVIECRSTAVSYIGDIRRLGYEPVLIELTVPDDQKEYNRWLHDKYYAYSEDKPSRIVETADDFEEALRTVSALSPVAILPGSDEGVELASRLSKALGLKGIDPDKLPALKKKDLMQEALKNAGLRYIRGHKISTKEEALDFFRECGSGKIVIKPVSGEATVGVCICNNEDEINKAVELNKGIDFGGNGFFVQEYIDGREFVVDMISSGGRNYPAICSSYNKIEIPGAGRVYHSSIFSHWNSPEFRELVEYAGEATKALGFSYGGSHSEYMVDKDGPVLIEINSRVQGGMLRPSYLDDMYGYHETDLSLRSMLFEDSFDKIMKGLPDRMLKYGVIRSLIFDRDRYVKRSRVSDLKNRLSTYVYDVSIGDDMLYKKTVDLSTNAGLIYLLGEEDAVKRDIAIIDDLEKNHPEELFDFE